MEHTHTCQLYNGQENRKSRTSFILTLSFFSAVIQISVRHSWHKEGAGGSIAFDVKIEIKKTNKMFTWSYITTPTLIMTRSAESCNCLQAQLGWPSSPRWKSCRRRWPPTWGGPPRPSTSRRTWRWGVFRFVCPPFWGMGLCIWRWWKVWKTEAIKNSEVGPRRLPPYHPQPLRGQGEC